jgi:hypothetical protein
MDFFYAITKLVEISSSSLGIASKTVFEKNMINFGGVVIPSNGTYGCEYGEFEIKPNALLKIEFKNLRLGYLSVFAWFKEDILIAVDLGIIYSGKNPKPVKTENSVLRGMSKAFPRFVFLSERNMHAFIDEEKEKIAFTMKSSKDKFILIQFLKPNSKNHNFQNILSNSSIYTREQLISQEEFFAKSEEIESKTSGCLFSLIITFCFFYYMIS